MCGRYTLFTSEEYAEIREIIAEAGRKRPDAEIKTGEIFPTNTVPVLVAGRGGPEPYPIKWGFPGFRGNNVIINARAETAQVKPLFRKSLYTKRCIIPSTGFYEWDKDKRKFKFNLPESGVLYMAGLYNEFNGEPRFLILTTAANPSVSPIHHRMPVILQKEECILWAEHTEKALALLHSAMPALNRELY